ncbi:MAG: peptidoglycan DD-metalloendopeptidase family protein [Pseudomonadales bacterium]
MATYPATCLSRVFNGARARRLQGLLLLAAASLLLGCATRGLPPVLDRSPQLRETPRSYMVRPGDTLYSIAWRYQLDVAALARWNRLQDPFVLQINQWLRLRAPLASGAPESAPRTEVIADGGSRPQPNSASRSPTDSRSNSKPSVAQQSKSAVVVPAASSWRWPLRTSDPVPLMRQTFGAEHPGIAFRVPTGQGALASSAGLVVYAGAGLGGYEHLIILRHANALLSAYSFDGTPRVAEKSVVKVGARLADISTVGRRGSLLYFELRRRGSPIDPRRIIR